MAEAVRKHNCPRWGCDLVVSDVLFCCLRDWNALSIAARNRISATARLPLLSGPRRRAIAQALDEWRALDAAARGPAGG